MLSGHGHNVDRVVKEALASLSLMYSRPTLSLAAEFLGEDTSSPAGSVIARGDAARMLSMLCDPTTKSGKEWLSNNQSVVEEAALTDFQERINSPTTQMFNKILGDMGSCYTVYQMLLLYGAAAGVDSGGDGRVEMAEVADYVNDFLGRGVAGADPAVVKAILAQIKSGTLFGGDRVNEVKLISPCGGFTVWSHKALVETFYSGKSGNDLLPTSLNSVQMESGYAYMCSKDAPVMSVIQVLDPTVVYGASQMELATLTSRHIPPVEMNKAIPYFNMQLRTQPEKRAWGYAPGITAEKFLVSGMNIGLLAGRENQMWMPNQTSNISNGTKRSPAGDLSFMTGMNGVPLTSQVKALDVEPEPSSGMELFTMPQTVTPMGQVNDAAIYRYGIKPQLAEDASYEDAAIAAHYTGQYSDPFHISMAAGSNQPWSGASIDRSRPFMSVTSFKAEVVPTRGTLSSQRATLQCILHDRGRMPDIKHLIQPSTLSKVEFEIEYGWSCNATNVYSALVNGMRDRAIYSMYGVNYAFTEEGQVKITFQLITKGTTQVNVTDAAMTGRNLPGWKAVEEAMEAVQIARAAASPFLASKQVADIGGTSYINTLSLNSTGNLISGKGADQIRSWIKTMKSEAFSGDPGTDNLVDAVETLRSSVQAADKTLQEDLTKKMNHLAANPAGTTAPFCSALVDLGVAKGLADKDGFKRIARQPWESIGDKSEKPTSLGAMIQLFVAQPLAASGLYDEVQTIYYCANLSAAASAGCNLSALPIDRRKIGRQSFVSLIQKEYKKYGGQFPITRFINFISDNFIEPDFSMCYGVSGESGHTGNPNYTYNKESGQITQKKITNRKNSEARTETALRKFYYNSEAAGTVEAPRPTPFKPVRLAIHFQVCSADGSTLMADIDPAVAGDLPANVKLAKHSVLRIHVTDMAAFGNTSPLDVMKDARTTSAGILICPPDRQIAGIGKELGTALYGEGQALVSYAPLFETMTGDSSDGTPEIIRAITKDIKIATDSDSAAVIALIEERNKKIKAMEAFAVSTDITHNTPSGPTINIPHESYKGLIEAFPNIDSKHFTEKNVGTFDAGTEGYVSYDTHQKGEVSANKIAATSTGLGGDYKGSVFGVIIFDINTLAERIEKLREEQDSESETNLYQLVASPNALIEFISQFYPTVVYGEEGSTINKINVKSDSNSKAATIHMIRALNKDGDATSSTPRGLPLRTMPVTVDMELLGNPFFRYMQQFFLRTDTGTTIDNLYAVTGITHEIEPGKYSTKLAMTVNEAYGVFQPLSQRLNTASSGLRGMQGWNDKEAWVGTGWWSYGRWIQEWEQAGEDDIYGYDARGQGLDWFGNVIEDALGDRGGMNPDGEMVFTEKGNTINDALQSRAAIRDTRTGKFKGMMYRWYRPADWSLKNRNGYLQVYDINKGPNKKLIGYRAFDFNKDVVEHRWADE